MQVPNWNPLAAGPHVETTVIAPLIDSAQKDEEAALLLEYIIELQDRIKTLEASVK